MFHKISVGESGGSVNYAILPGMEFEYAAGFVKKKVDERLEKFFSSKKSSCRQEQIKILIEQVADFTLRGGKRTRPFLCWMGHQAVHSSQLTVSGNTLFNVMAGIELFQSFALIHDDILDEDASRRGKPTVHEYFGKVYGKHFGESMAILAGDLALVWADECMKIPGSRPGFEPRILQIYQKMKEEMIYGQTLDIAKNQAGKKINQNEIDTLKTAYYSVVRPLQIGAALAGAKEDYLIKLENFGLPAGRLFQLRDDYLDRTLSAKEFEKKAVSFIQNASNALKRFELSDEGNKLFGDFLEFVYTRKA